MFPYPLLFLDTEMINISENREPLAKRRSKYNVGTDESKRTYDGILFDSCMEMKYYRDVILPLSRSGEILEYELQKPYVLQPKFHNGQKTVQPIIYVADFYVKYKDGRTEVIDTKGCADSTAKIKRKMFWYHYPNTAYRWITHVIKFGGWIDYDEANRLRRIEKKKRKMPEVQNERNVDNEESK